MTQEKTIIIGAGIAGLEAARTLSQHGDTPLVLEKSKSVGGRMATRRLTKGQADHGAQCFTAKNNTFVGLKNDLLVGGQIREWYRGLPAPHESANTGIYPRYCGSESMNAVAKHLAQDLNVQLGSAVKGITRANQMWKIKAGKKNYTAENLILTPPVPQSLELLDESGADLEEHFLDELRGLTYRSCITVMARFDKATGVPSPGSLYLSRGSVEWINDNQQKGISDEPVVTIQCHHRFSHENYEENDEKLQQDILASVSEWLPGDPVEVQIHRWRYAKPLSVASTPCFISEEKRLVFAGDAFVDGRIEGAYLSGRAAGFAVMQMQGIDNPSPKSAV